MDRLRHTGPILIAEDDHNIAHLLAKYLKREGFDTLEVDNGTLALDQFRHANPLLVVLDVMLPGMNGWDICEQIRLESDTPILMLTARSLEQDRIRGFTQGADDYVTKPFSPREVVERIKAILRRSGWDPSNACQVLRYADLEVDPNKINVRRNGANVALTASEFTLLYTLISRPGRVFSRNELLDRIHPDHTVVIDRVIDVHIGNLRHKLEPDPCRPSYILTKRGIGYHFNDAL